MIWCYLKSIITGVTTEMTQIQIVTDIINRGFEAGKLEDEIIVEIIESGVTYKDAGKLYNKIACDESHIISRAERKKAVWKILDEEKLVPTRYEQVEDMAVRFSEGVGSIAGLDRINAFRLIKAWAALNKIKLPKRIPIGSKKHLIGVGFRGAVMTWMLERAAPTVEEIAAHIGELQKKASAEKNMQKAKKFYEYYTFSNAVKREE